MSLPHMDATKRQHYVYRAYDFEGDLLYVGITVSLKRRWAEHRKNGRWAGLAVRFKVSGPFNYSTAKTLERYAINTEAPAFNRDCPVRVAAEGAHRATFDRAYYQALSEGKTSTQAVHFARAFAPDLPDDNRKLIFA